MKKSNYQKLKNELKQKGLWLQDSKPCLNKGEDLEDVLRDHGFACYSIGKYNVFELDGVEIRHLSFSGENTNPEWEFTRLDLN